MIVREFIKHPELTDKLLKEFDYFNNTKDTLDYLKRVIKYGKPSEVLHASDVIELIEKGAEKYWINFWSKDLRSKNDN